ncbi:MAG: DegT/DnrJ/EryC1/StrS family aminotransferase [Heliobacteriaceae bacterium]|nr:DegT/DnrJ/EryC1/StrS family aminotransferase [Heliobacteriaceae bacterium]
MQERPLWQALTAWRQEKVAGYHTPGHGQGRGLAGYRLDPAIDVTEIPGLDDLHTPDGVIAAAQGAAARAFGARQTFFLVQGATVGLQALLLGGLSPGEPVVVPRHSHRAVFGGLVLSGAVPRYVPPVCEPETGLPLVSDPGEISDAAKGAKALLALRPSYWGTVEDLTPWLAAAREQEVPLWVDAAHGAAFAFCSRLPAAALALGAEAVVHGTHKTLPALTQAAMLHLGGSPAPAWAGKAAAIARALTLLQTTSPSYLLLASLELAQARMAVEGETLWAAALERAAGLRKKLNRIKGIHCWGEEIKAYPGVGDWDPTRLVVVLRRPGLNGYQVRRVLRQSYSLEAELAGPNYLLFLLSPFDRPEADRRLVRALREIGGEKGGQATTVPNTADLPVGYRIAPEIAFTPREAFFRPVRRVVFKEAKNRIAGEFLCPYPPGIPLAAPGEVITPVVWAVVAAWRQTGVRWQGAGDPHLTEIAVIDG